MLDKQLDDKSTRIRLPFVEVRKLLAKKEKELINKEKKQSFRQVMGQVDYLYIGTLRGGCKNSQCR